MSLPFLQSYTDPKKEKAYRRYLAGESQRKVAERLKMPARTVAFWSKADGWEAERRARKIAAESPNVAAVAASGEEPAPSAATQSSTAPESRAVGMASMLGLQQRIAGILTDALRKDIEATVTAAEATGKPLSRSQVSQLTTLTGNLFALERKAWCVPDKIETKDTTPTLAERIATATEDELSQREKELDDQLAAAGSAEGGACADRGGTTPPERVN